MHKFFVKSDDVFGNTISITGDDARHLALSLRMKIGEKITVSTPDMTDHLCVIKEISPELVTLSVEESLPASGEPPYRLKLYQAIPKSDKLEFIIQKAVECGAFSVIPFESKFCVARIKDPEKKLERWNRIAYEAAKQSGRSIVPRVEAPLSFKDAVKMASEDELSVFCYENERGVKLGELLKKSDPKTISVVIGSEGGFSEDEVEFAEAEGLTVTGLGARILRCETASVFVLSAVSAFKELS